MKRIEILKKYQIILFQIVAHLTLFSSLFLFSWKWLIVSLIFYILFCGIGVSVTFHRYTTHRAFDLPIYMQIIGLFFGTVAGVACCNSWTKRHVLHHMFSDKDGDPHNPHTTNYWNLYWKNIKIEEESPTTSLEFLKFTKIETFFSTHYWKIHTFYAIIMMTLGMEWFIFAYLVPASLTWIAFGFGITILGHTSGYRNFDTDDQSRNNTIVALLSFGEGYQNNHHKFDRDGIFSKTHNEIDFLGKIFNKYFPPSAKSHKFH